MKENEDKNIPPKTTIITDENGNKVEVTELVQGKPIRQDDTDVHINNNVHKDMEVDGVPGRNYKDTEDLNVTRNALENAQLFDAMMKAHNEEKNNENLEFPMGGNEGPAVGQAENPFAPNGDYEDANMETFKINDFLNQQNNPNPQGNNGGDFTEENNREAYTNTRALLAKMYLDNQAFSSNNDPAKHNGLKKTVQDDIDTLGAYVNATPAVKDHFGEENWKEKLTEDFKKQGKAASGPFLDTMLTKFNMDKNNVMQYFPMQQNPQNNIQNLQNNPNLNQNPNQNLNNQNFNQNNQNQNNQNNQPNQQQVLNSFGNSLKALYLAANKHIQMDDNTYSYHAQNILNCIQNDSIKNNLYQVNDIEQALRNGNVMTISEFTAQNLRQFGFPDPMADNNVQMNINNQPNVNFQNNLIINNLSNINYNLVKIFEISCNRITCSKIMFRII